MKQSISVAAFLAILAFAERAHAKPDNCCCDIDGDGTYDSVEKFCIRNGGVCGAPADCETFTSTTTSTSTVTTTTTTTSGGTCNSGAPAGGPQIAMAWVSDQYANFDQEWAWDKGCTNPSDPSDASSNQFACCHDWLVSDFAGINTVSLTFLKPTEILDPTTCAAGTCTELGVRVGMPGAIKYFNETMSLVFVSIGGITYTESWEEVLVDVPTAENFAVKVADIAKLYNVGVEIDYEESADPHLVELEAFVRKYRELIPFEPADPSPPSFLTLDFGQGAQFMGVSIAEVLYSCLLMANILTPPKITTIENCRLGSSKCF